MRHCTQPGTFLSLLIITALVSPLLTAHAAVKVSVERAHGESTFDFKTIPAPARNDAATQAEFTLVDGERDRNGGSLDALHDGRIPSEEDQPSANFFFRAGSEGGRIRVDLSHVSSLKQVNSYSLHTGSRAPQVYKLYGADGSAKDFNNAPRRGTDPATCGWTLLASVDTREQVHEEGGCIGASVAEAGGGELGRFRYLLFDVSRTENRDAFGQTFFSEIDVIETSGPALLAATSGATEPVLKKFEAEDGRYHFTIDATVAPDLMEWADANLRPVVQEWYPKLVKLLPGEGFVARTNVTLRFRTDMGGTPASADRGQINLNTGWFRRELKREAVGSVVHEMTHVVQSYGQAGRNANRAPGWLVEGIADYVRWFLYEPQNKGAEITRQNLERARYDASYRVTANFLDWVARHHDAEIVRKLNSAAREGRYTEALWKDLTGQTLPELGAAWKKDNEERLKGGK